MKIRNATQYHVALNTLRSYDLTMRAGLPMSAAQVNDAMALDEAVQAYELRRTDSADYTKKK